MSAHLLPVARLEVLALCPVDISAVLCVEAMQPMRLLVNKSIVLRDELPADFRRNNVRFNGHVGRGGSRRHLVYCVIQVSFVVNTCPSAPLCARLDSHRFR